MLNAFQNTEKVCAKIKADELETCTKTTTYYTTTSISLQRQKYRMWVVHMVKGEFVLGEYSEM